MTTISLKLPEALLREIEETAAARGAPKSAVIRESLEATLRRGKKPGSRVSCLDLMGDFVGSFHGPADLSMNRAGLSGSRLSG